MDIFFGGPVACRALLSVLAAPCTPPAGPFFPPCFSLDPLLADCCCRTPLVYELDVSAFAACTHRTGNVENLWHCKNSVFLVPLFSVMHRLSMHGLL